MKNMKFWRTALVATLVLTVMLSVTGGTIAWFTDEVTSGQNKIEAGNLDIDLYMYNGSEYVEITDKSAPIFGGAASLVAQNNNADTLWEPGKTQVAYLKLVNNGNLALKYNVGLNVVSETNNLSQAMLYAITPDAKNGAGVDGWNAANAKDVVLGQQNASDAVSLGKGDTHYFALSIHMKEEAGNEYQGGTADFDITVYATQDTVEADSFGTDYDEGAVPAVTYVKTPAEAQAALDAATSGTVITLAPGVNYGTLYLRPVDGQANTTKNLNEADGEGLTVYRNEWIRKVENLTIVGAPGATVDAIEVDSGYVKDSGSTCHLVDVKNLVIDSVEFTDDYVNPNASHNYSAPIFFDLSYTDVDGLTVQNCKLIGDNDKMNLVYFYSSGKVAYDNVASNITITNNTVEGIARLCELRQTENVTITGNMIKDMDQHGMLLAANGGTYSGNVTITGNTADGINDRFVRMAGAGNANVVIKNNTIKNYKGKEADYIKVTDATNGYANEDNGLASVGVKEATTDALKAALQSENVKAGTAVVVPAGNYTFPASDIKAGVTIECEEGTVFDGQSNLNINGATVKGATFSNEDGYAVRGTINGTFKDCTFTSSEALRWCYTEAGETAVFENCVIKTDFRGVHFDAMNGDVTFRNCTIAGFNACGGEGTLSFENCTFVNDNSSYNGLNLYCNTNLTNCTFNYVSGKTNFIDMEGTGKTLKITNCVATLDGAAANISDFVGGSQLANNTLIIDGEVITN